MPEEFKFTAGAQLPGEALVVAILTFMSKHRETMSQENRDVWDKVQISQLRGWTNYWISLGWPGEKV